MFPTSLCSYPSAFLSSFPCACPIPSFEILLLFLCSASLNSSQEASSFPIYTACLPARGTLRAQERQCPALWWPLAARRNKSRESPALPLLASLEHVLLLCGDGTYIVQTACRSYEGLKHARCKWNLWKMYLSNFNKSLLSMPELRFLRGL